MGCGMSCANKDRMKNSNRVSVESDANIYHEKQSRELCALHALNNLFQDSKAFNKLTLDELCRTLSPDTYINPHKSFLGLGNYDVNVIMAALQTKNYDTIWFDKRKDTKHLQVENIYGFILNIPTDLEWGYIKLPIHRKHWIAVRQIDGKYFNLDSKIDAPESIGSDDELRSYLREQIQCKDKELLLVVDPVVAQSGLWYDDASKRKDVVPNGTAEKNIAKDDKDCGTSSTNSRSSNTQMPGTSNYNPETKV